MAEQELTQDFLEKSVRVGQFRTCRRNNPDSAFLVTGIYQRQYRDGNSRLRVTGVKVHNGERVDSDDFDAASVFQMYPHVKFASRPYDDS